MNKILGANWQTTVSMLGGVLMSAITWLATVSYDQGPIALVIPPEYKPTLTWVCGFCALILFAWNGIQQKSKNTTGGSVQQDVSGAVVPPGKASLVRQTINDTPLENR